MNSWDETRLECENLTVRRGGRVVLADLSFHIAAGEALVVTGHNGSGKSTLLRTVAGLIAPLQGNVRLSGRTIPDDVHLVGHLNALKSHTSVFENALFFARWQGGGEGAAERAEAALAQVGLAAFADGPAAFLSQGQRRRLALARLIASPRVLWLLDEPVAGLDTASRTMFAAAMGGHLAAGGLILAATHEPLGLAAARELSL